ncbi:MAG: hypothetical protein OEZ58_18325, partial [Gammaproteobacteria bacterium]|nr:hypothetical protein [Gammaproteobacteria bacterium]
LLSLLLERNHYSGSDFEPRYPPRAALITIAGIFIWGGTKSHAKPMPAPAPTHAFFDFVTFEYGALM